MVSLKDNEFIGKEELPSDLVPTEMGENLRWRQEIIRWCRRNPERQQLVSNACNRDLLFFTNSFVWVSDVKRHPEAPNRPFIAWDFQKEVLLDMDRAIGKRSVGIVKSRDLGGSTMPLVVFDRRLLFFRSMTMMVMSRNEKFVDDPRNPDSLFYKLDFIHRWLPSWMTSSLARLSMTLTNTRLDSNIIGSSTSGDAGRGGRKQAILVDEFAAFDRKESFEVLGSLQHNSKCRIYNSTPKGIGNGFHQIITAGNILIHKLHWSQHPVHGAGRYTSENGELKLIDEDYWKTKTPNQILEEYPELEKKLAVGDGLAVKTYPFLLDNKLRSPYYDYECLLCPIPKLISQELDMDFIGSGSPFFDLDELREYVELFGRPPLYRGEITYELQYEDIKWEKSYDGRLELWFHPDRKGNPAADRRYVVGCDISAGTGHSNSTISVGDTQTRSKIAAMATPHMRPERFAGYVFAVGKWFNDAKIVFEGSGPGSDFGARLKELGYGNLYRQTKTSGEKAKKPGWFPDGEMKRNLLTEYGRALQMREFTNPDRTAVNECQMYEFTEAGLVAHVGSVSAADPSGAKKNHGDRVIADALCWMEVKKAQRVKSGKVASKNSIAYLHAERERMDARQNDWSPRDTPRAWSLVKR